MIKTKIIRHFYYILVVLLLFSTFGCLETSRIQDTEKTNLSLNNTHLLLDSNTIIIIGNESSSIEFTSAKKLQSFFFENIGEKPEIKVSQRITESTLVGKNLILIGTFNSNSLLSLIQNETEVDSIWEKSKLKGKGLLLIVPNPWNIENKILVIAGNDTLGLEAATTFFEQNYADLTSNKISVAYQDILSDKIAPTLKNIVLQMKYSNLIEKEIPIFINIDKKLTHEQINLVQKSGVSELTCFETTCIGKITVENVSNLAELQFIKNIDYGGEEGTPG
ncbi:hypothetical protein [Methanolobus sp. WCC4]|uniref:hypothetical protein n=1 Tax=Methanolobus sp. WCC4 TaxID=3125784 RepID=UPI0030F58DE3